MLSYIGTVPLVLHSQQTPLLQSPCRDLKLLTTKLCEVGGQIWRLKTAFQEAHDFTVSVQPLRWLFPNIPGRLASWLKASSPNPFQPCDLLIETAVSPHNY